MRRARIPILQHDSPTSDSRHGSKHTRAELWLSQHDGEQKVEDVGQVAFISARLAIPRGPFAAEVRFVDNSVVELSLFLAPQHGVKHPVSFCRFARNIMRRQEMRPYHSIDAAILILLKSVGAIF